jgi:ArsR family transcriptional regulator, lead/cadmium/zinc/bismuth-responsive transcriptional repressor
MEEQQACSVIHDPAKLSLLQTKVLSDASAGELAETFRVLGDVTRVRILDALSRSELCVCDVARLLGLSESAVSHQLRLLRGMRLVRPRREGRMMFYTLDDQHIIRLFEQGLEHVEERAARRFGLARSGHGQLATASAAPALPSKR